MLQRRSIQVLPQAQAPRDRTLNPQQQARVDQQVQSGQYGAGVAGQVAQRGAALPSQPSPQLNAQAGQGGPRAVTGALQRQPVPSAVPPMTPPPAPPAMPGPQEQTQSQIGALMPRPQLASAALDRMQAPLGGPRPQLPAQQMSQNSQQLYGRQSYPWQRTS